MGVALVVILFFRIFFVSGSPIDGNTQCGMIFTSYYLLGGDWNHGMDGLTFPLSWEWNVIIPTDFHSLTPFTPSFFRGVGGSTTNQIIINQ